MELWSLWRSGVSWLNIVSETRQAETIKVIYYLYVNGWSSREIADLLTEYKRETKIGNTEWDFSSVINILDNERHH